MGGVKRLFSYSPISAGKKSQGREISSISMGERTSPRRRAYQQFSICCNSVFALPLTSVMVKKPLTAAELAIVAAGPPDHRPHDEHGWRMQSAWLAVTTIILSASRYRAMGSSSLGASSSRCLFFPVRPSSVKRSRCAERPYVRHGMRLGMRALTSAVLLTAFLRCTLGSSLGCASSDGSASFQISVPPFRFLFEIF